MTAAPPRPRAARRARLARALALSCALLLAAPPEAPAQARSGENPAEELFYKGVNFSRDGM